MDELTARRLAVIRHLFEKGKTLSLEGEPLNGLCLLPFHDSVEMFMKLCADVRDKEVTRKTMFADYFDLLPELQDKAQMISLNSRRVSLKHYGQMPSSLDVELSRANAIDFFEHNVPVFFSCRLEDVSLEVLIPYPEVKEYLYKYHNYLSEGKYGHAQAQCQIAMKTLLVAYHDQYGRKVSLQESPARNAEWLSSPNLEANTDRCLMSIKEDILSINEAITIMNLGINYFKYEEFIALGPHIVAYKDNQYDYYLRDETGYTEETVKACYDFVIEAGLKLIGSKVFLY